MYEDEFWYYESHVGGTFGHAARSSKRTLSLLAATTNYNGRVVGRERSDDTFNRMFCTLCRGPKYSSDYFYYKTRSLGTMASLCISGNHAATLLQRIKEIKEWLVPTSTRHRPEAVRWKQIETNRGLNRIAQTTHQCSRGQGDRHSEQERRKRMSAAWSPTWRSAAPLSRALW